MLIEQEEKQIIAKKGDLIQCWECGKILYELTTDIYRYQRIISSLFRSVSNDIKQPVPLDRMICPICSKQLLVSGNFKIVSTGKNEHTAKEH